jgi:putative ABC transport system substrate-binding protein
MSASGGRPPASNDKCDPVLGSGPAADDHGPNLEDLYRRAAIYVDKIFRGAMPADLPVEQPIKFDFVINLKTANALGVDVPLQLQQLADEVIE